MNKQAHKLIKYQNKIKIPHFLTMRFKTKNKKIEPGQKRNTIQEDNIRQFLRLVIDNSISKKINQPHRKQKLC